MKVFTLGKLKIVVKEGDITEEDVDAIVNPANSQMIMGGGVAGAIKRKGGDIIEKEAMKYAPVPVGKAISTTAGKLKAKYVIHAPTMERPAMSIPPENVRKAVQGALDEAIRLGIKSIAFPAMGAGVGGVPIETSVRIILEVIKEYLPKLEKLEEVRLIAWGKEAYEKFLRVTEEFTRG